MKKKLYNLSWLGIFLFTFGIYAQKTTPLINSKLDGTVKDVITKQPLFY